MNIKRYDKTYIRVRKLNDGVVRMAVLTARKPIAFAIKREKMKEFIEEANRNKISKEFLKECMEIAKLFEEK